MNDQHKNEQNSVTMNSIAYHDPEMVAAPMGDELVMFSLDRGMYYGLDDIASHIWQHLAEPISVTNLCSALLDEFDVDRETCENDTLDLLNWLYRQGLVKIDRPAA